MDVKRGKVVHGVASALVDVKREKGGVQGVVSGR